MFARSSFVLALLLAAACAQTETPAPVVPAATAPSVAAKDSAPLYCVYEPSDTLRAEEDLDEVHDCLVPAAKNKLAEALAHTVETLVDPACVWKPTDPASANPRVSECPLPEELRRELTPDSYRSIPAGVLAFVSAWAAVDSALFARLHQRALLVCDWEAEVEYTADHECLVNGQPEALP